MRRRVVRHHGMGLAVALLVAGPLAGQRPAAADGVALIVRPHVGDTLRLQVDQSVEVRRRRGRPPDGSLDQSSGRSTPWPQPEHGPRAEREAVQVTRVQLFAHSLVEASDLRATTLVVRSDSIALWSGRPGEDAVLRPLVLADAGRPFRVQVTPDGAMRVDDPPPSAAQVGATLASIPGLLPAGRVRVGQTWAREMALPSVPVGGYRADGVLQVRLRLDSLTHGGRQAWVSLVGMLRRDGAARELPPGTRVITAGTLRGTMLVDRERAWIVDAWTRLEVQSDVVAGPAGTAPPMLLDFRIEQRVRVR
jgi:hypothetical protein